MAKALFVAAIVYALWWLLLRKPRRPRLGEDEARSILGVTQSADAEAIRAAHRRLVSALHPDRGGSTELTRRINAARDLLLKRTDH